MKTMLRKAGFTAVAMAACLMAFSVNLSAKELPGKGKSVQPARATWSSGFFLEALYSRALEDLGYEVEDPKKLANPIFFKSLWQGDVDFWANSWFPIHNAQLPRNFEDKAVKVAGTIVKAGALQGYLVSKKDAEKYNITSLDDFKREEVKKAFDANHDGKADLVACPPGWGCEKAISFHMDAYDLNDDINLIKAGYAASMADAVARYDNGEPVFFYTWTPNWTVNKFKPGKDVVWINVPETITSDAQKGFEDAMVAKDVPGLVTNPCKMGFAANDIAVSANKKFLKANPAIAKVFSLMSVSMSDISAQNSRMYKGEDKQKDIERHVTQWIEKNQEQWDAWIAAGIAAGK